MKNSVNQIFKFYNGVVLYPFYMVLLIWVVFYADYVFDLNLGTYGIYPRKVDGLKGILFSPLLHGSPSHLFSNTLPLFFLSAALFYFYRNIAWRVFIVGYLLTGLLTWCIGRPSFHIGASGVIYMLCSFIFFKGIFSGYFRLIALSLVVVFVYGGLIWYVLPVKEEISWEGHLSGFLVGLLCAYIFKTPKYKSIRYKWQRKDYKEEDDAFMRHFDADGNFVSESKQLEKLREELGDDYEDTNPQFNYIFKRATED